jgi:tRNA dimethylallyltransferase
LAEKYNGRIISADSRQIYRRLDVGTAKPSPGDRSRIPHYMVDVAEIDEDFTAKRYAEMAAEAMREILDAGAVPLVVGGAGLYLAALTGGLFEGPAADRELRWELEAEADQLGLERLHRELSRIDPEAAQRIGPGDRVRIIRAIEVYRLTGYKISELQTSGFYSRLDIDFLWLGVTFERERLYERINRRVDRMVADGLVDEVIELRDAGFGNPLRKKRIVGYYEVLDALDGVISMGQAIDLVKQHSRNYAKRQMTWFRHKAPVTWLIPDISDFYSKVFATTDDYLNNKA